MSNFTLTTPKPVGPLTAIDIPTNVLSMMACGLHRATFGQAYALMPELKELFDSAPIPEEHRSQYVVDVKIHMLMPNQWPCVPNWHCDNVRRDENGLLDYNSTIDSRRYPMFIWLSGNPVTEFLAKEIDMRFVPKSHGQVAGYIDSIRGEMEYHESQSLFQSLEAQRWYEFDTATPHRGTMSRSNQWRIFCRLVPNILLEGRPSRNPLRRHAQVYLDSARFSW